MDKMELSNVFSDDLNSLLEIDIDYDKKEFKYTWLELFEEVIPYISNILRNPKRFIVNEEEVVKVELSKKVTVESIIHLTQHTNLIQDFDEEKGDVRPSKVLNINKEESLDTYENRFIFTLLNNMVSFYDKYSPLISDSSYLVDKKIAKYEGNTRIGTEEVKISLHYSSINKNVTTAEKKDGATIEERLKKIKTQLDGFTCTELYQTLNKLHVAAVRSPIKKTNVILKNPNFQKAVELWNYIQSYTGEDCVSERVQRKISDVGEIKSQFDESFLLNYCAINSLSEQKNVVSEKKAIALALSRVIENILDMNDEILEDKLKKVFKDEFKHAKDRFDKRNDKIIKVFSEKMDKINKQYNDACNVLR